MRILYHHRTRSKDGQNVHIEELTRALAARGHEIVVVAPPGYDSEQFGADAGLVATLKRFIPKAAYELIEVAYSAHAYRRLRRAARAQAFDVIYERYNLHCLAGLWLRRRTGLKLLLEVNAPLAEERAKHDGLAFPGLARWTERLIWRGADAVLPVTQVLAGHVRAAGVPDDRIVVIANGIDRARFPERSRAAREAAKAKLGLSGRLVLGFTGFMRPWHGLERVIDHMAEAPAGHDMHFLVVGDGTVKDAIAAAAAARGVADRLTLAGLVDRDRIADYVAAFDIALQPDVVPYASPLKLFEYMAMGCAIVAPGMANIREVLTDGHDAALFDPADPGGFRAALDRLCRDAALRDRLGAAASRTIDARGFTWADNARRVEEIARRLAAPDAAKRASLPGASDATI